VCALRRVQVPTKLLSKQSSNKCDKRGEEEGDREMLHGKSRTHNSLTLPPEAQSNVANWLLKYETKFCSFPPQKAENVQLKL